MHFSTILVLNNLLVLFAKAQSNATYTFSISSSVGAPTTVSLSPAQSSEASCLASCAATDTTCRANCITLSLEGYAEQNHTIECISACPHGNGTAVDNLAYENCQKACLSSATVVSASIPSATATSGSAPKKSVEATSATVTQAAKGSSTKSSAPSSATSEAAADTLYIKKAWTGVVILAAVFSL
ncbi:hypothetical protein F5884DRAFT_770021 [Xylogone sp. PMI_703]|nr:hypothetical protein F5884DRAFT_770021 [Xylogone sp. PMI_703]